MGEERAYQNALRGPMPLADALGDFCKKFSDKTKNAWAERKGFETVRGCAWSLITDKYPNGDHKY